MTEYQVTFQKFNRRGARSLRTVVVQAENEKQAVHLAILQFKKDYPNDHGYRYASIFS